MSSDFLIRDGSAVRWAASGADKLWTLTSLANGAGRAGDAADLGATRAELYGYRMTLKPASSPPAGELIDLALAISNQASAWPGGVSGADEAFADDDRFNQLVLLRPLVLDDSTASQSVHGVFRATGRHMVPVILNRSGVSLASGVSDHELVIWPLLGTSS